jgi:hypothetical protein
METAGEGGAWGMAVLAIYMINGKDKSLSDYLSDTIFDGQEGLTITASQEEIDGFDRFMEVFKATLPIEQTAVDTMKG